MRLRVHVRGGGGRDEKEVQKPERKARASGGSGRDGRCPGQAESRHKRKEVTSCSHMSSIKASSRPRMCLTIFSPSWSGWMHVRINEREQACADIRMTLLMDAHGTAKDIQQTWVLTNLES